MDDTLNLKKRLDLKLKDFTPDLNANVHWSDVTEGNPVELKPESVPSPYIVFIIFPILKEYPHIRRCEKIAWEIPLQYKGTSFMLAHRKFGFQIRSINGTPEQAQLAQKAIYRIGKAISTAEEMLQPIIRSQVNCGAITLANDYHHLRRRCEYFREQAKEHLQEVNEPEDSEDSCITIQEKLNADSARYNRDVERKQRAGYYAFGMIDSYFSLLEHVLVLVKPFVHLNGTESNLADFIGSNWGDKFNAIFDIGSNQRAKQIYDSLIAIKEAYRNPSAHGNFQKAGGSLHVHIPSVGAIPMQMSKSKNDLRFSFTKGQEFAEVCAKLDEVDLFLDENETSFGMIFVKSGAEVAFDKSSKRRYAASMNDQDEFKQFVDQICRRIDDAYNMDW